MLTIGLLGATGRMGLAIQAAAQSTPTVNIVALERTLAALPTGLDVVIDFSSPQGLQRLLPLVVAAGIPLVSGTTGLDDATQQALDDASRHIPLLWASNTSLGVALLGRLVREAAARLPQSFDIEIVEAHHRRKQDAPSGTALTLVEHARAGRNTPDATVRHGREGWTGPRPSGDIGVHAVRGGTVIGEHSVMFLGEFERLTLSHVAEDRQLFARGALSAAQWLHARTPGRYTMQDVVA